MPISSLFTERVDGINGYVNIPAVNSTLFWRNASGVVGTLPTSNFASIAGDNAFNGSNYFTNVGFLDLVDHDEASITYTASSFTFDLTSKTSLLGALDLTTVAKKDVANTFTQTTTLAGVVVNGSTTWSASAAFVYAGAAAPAHRSALGLGTLATQNGTFSGTSSGSNTGDQDLSGYVDKATNQTISGAKSFTGGIDAAVNSSSEHMEITAGNSKNITITATNGDIFLRSGGALTITLNRLGGVHVGLTAFDPGENNLSVEGKIIAAGTTAYANDAAADADTALLSGGLYRITGSRAIYRKP